MGEMEEITGSWLRIGAVPAVALTWGVNHRTEDLPLSPSLYICLCSKNKINLKLWHAGLLLSHKKE